MRNTDKAGQMSGLRRIYLILRCVLTVVVLAAAIKSCGIVAHAEDVVLTPQQTAALLGSSFPVTYHNSQTNIELSMTATLIGTTDDFDLYYRGDNFAMPFHYPNLNHQNAIAPYNYADGLVYSVPFANVGDFVSSNSDAFFNFSNSFSISLDGLTKFEMPIFWGATRNASRSNRSAYNVYTSNGIMSGSGFDQGGSLHNYWQAYFFKSEDVNQDYDADVSDRIYLNCFPIDLSSDSEFSVTGITCGYNACNTYNLVDNSLNVGFFYIIVEYPVLSSFTPVTTPAVTSSVTTTRAPYTGEFHVTTAQFTYDLSPLETNQLNQIRIQNEQLQYEAGVFDGINIIIQQLNDIYNRMVQSGEISVDLVGGFDWSVNSDVNSFINDSLTTYTMTQMNYTDIWIAPLAAYNSLDSYNFLKPFAVVGLFSIGFGVFCWFLFIGRKGG